MSGSKYQYTEDMNEISGFGGGYEEACRKMVVAGLEWWDAHPDADPKFHGFKDVYGLAMEDNDDAKALSSAMVSVCDDCTGAMHQATVGHVFWIHKNGWDKYVEESKRRAKAKDGKNETTKA